MFITLSAKWLCRTIEMLTTLQHLKVTMFRNFEALIQTVYFKLENILECR